MKQALLAGTALIGILAVTPVYAADPEAMAAQLRTMQAQMRQMQKDMDKMRAELAATKTQTKTALKAADESKASKLAKPETDVKITMSPAPKFETADGAYSFKVGGFGQVDAGVFSDDRRDHPDGTNVRRARLNVSGVIARDFNYKLENDFAGNVSAITDAYVEYVGFKPGDLSTSLMIGQFKEPFGLETLTSDLFTTFMERALPFAFAPDRNIGAAASVRGDSPIGMVTASLGAFGAGTGVASNNDEAFDVTGRLTIAPLAESRRVLHIGIAGSRRIPDSATDIMRFSSRPETRLTSSTAISGRTLTVDTGDITSVDAVNLLGLEAAGVYGPFSLQGEYMTAIVDRTGGLARQNFDSYYAEASYFLTGESRNYVPAQARFDRVKPKWAFNPSENSWGAWQVSARYSALDLNDTVVKGGKVKDITLGLRWIPQPNLSFMANYIFVDSDAFATVANDDPQIFMLRAQFDF